MTPELPPLPAFAIRAKRAAEDIAEALAVNPQTPPAQPGAPPPPQGLPPPMMPPGGQPPPQPNAPGPRPAISPLQMLPDFKSPPLAAALQGAAGREGPVGFAAGGRVDFAVMR